MIANTAIYKMPPQGLAGDHEQVLLQRQSDTQKLKDLMEQNHVDYDQVLNQAMSMHQNEEGYENDHHASLFERVELQIQHALHVIADPKNYVK